MKKYKSVYKEQNLKLDDNKKIANYVESIFPELKKYKKDINKNSITYYGSKEGYSFDIAFYDHVDPSFILLKAQLKPEVSSVSLADPKKAYQTTSARRVKHKKIKLEKDVDSIEEAKKVINAFKKRLNKQNVSF